MAVFLINVCKFNGCEKIFPSLSDLIHHIENTHIDDSQAPEVTEKTQPTCLPLSYVLRFVTDNTRRDGVLGSPVAVPSNGTDRTNPTLVANGTGVRLTNATASINQTADHQHGSAAAAATGATAATTTTTNSSTIAGSNGGGGGGVTGATTTNGCSTDHQNGGSVGPAGGGTGVGLDQAKNHLNQTVGTTDLKRKIAIKHHSYSISASNRSTTPTGSEMDDDEMMVSESEDSNDSWTTEEFSSEFIMRYGSRRHSASGGGGGINSSNEKPFACPVPGCKKRYKNVNGIKYHSKNGHKKDGNRVRKAFKCYCGKSYKTAQRLKNHNMLVHATATRNGSPVDGTNLQAAVPLTSPALPSATLISAPVKSPPLSNGGSPNTVVVSSTSSSSSSNSNSSIVTAVAAAATAAAIASSQIGTNATTTNTTCTSPSTLTITQVTHSKVPRGLVLAAAAASAAPTTVASPVIPPATVFPVSPSSSSLSSTSSVSAGVSPVNIKYDNLGILTPATSPKLIAANLCQEANQLPTVVSSTGGGGSGANSNTASSSLTSVAIASVLGGISLKSVTGGNVGGPGGGGGGGSGNGGSNAPGELVSAGGNVGIALVVSSAAVAGNESKLSATTTGSSGGNNNKNAVLSASVSAGQLYAEET
ncbi:uncharacterized transmembrane protein DDB_G0289901 [Anopheles stephensi]|uniref:uncharacterized transmembrane protein DDB_G0289901 n=1 Tax=Anopheles stephensi TaxID=30069 RepID=UPI0016588E5F|nr:uncharacterized transmembrane protein DDB_G0289901 [Anopheles stephensi]XP_035919599.1 uncharacterized transmembrane protein DDB_G0289901 [Anopheles stephensi]XP_035919600.1 uncharacterized transmembrane protein DDB_G0289901 [Anopheles stephensi]XP_035919601.1 uncharacterized transmembrane protein DDB_G0289901 [Anopheles stephensi]XP_035919602.1 uncharacterized transmembrane protein DDB_G0289901 [Anopheles stephensi]